MSISSMASRSGRILKDDNTVVNEGNLISPTPSNHETLSISSTAKTLTAATYADALTALISVETADIRYWLDGTAPTTTAGVLLSKGDILVLQSPAEISGFKTIAASTDATIQVAYSK